MSKRFSTFVGGTVKKKSAVGFVPWQNNDFIPSEIKEGSVRSALIYIYSRSSENLKKEGLPKIALKNQLYSIMGSRTKVDQEVNRLRENVDIKMFKTSLGLDQFCIMFTNDYIAYIRSLYNDHQPKSLDRTIKTKSLPLSLTRFITEFVTSNNQISIDKNCLIQKYKFKDSDITELIKVGVLTVKDAGTWWLAIPCAGKFIKVLRKGRQATLQVIRRTKYKELNCNELLKRKPPPSVKLGFQYQIHDLVGADLITCHNATTGLLLRAADD